MHLHFCPFDYALEIIKDTNVRYSSWVESSEALAGRQKQQIKQWRGIYGK